jgi:hypothetical protein
MTTLRLTDRPKATAYHDEAHGEDRLRSRFAESELMDLYAALLIVVPLALFLKSLWS